MIHFQRLYAPEILSNQGYSFTADYYNLGIITYELVSRELAFAKQIEKKDLNNGIYSGNIEIPSNLSPNLQNFLKKLLEPNPRNRLGKNGIHEIINHPWLQDAITSPPFKFPVFNINKFVRRVDPDIDKGQDVDFIPISWYDERYPCPLKRKISSFSLYSQEEFSGSDDENKLDEHTNNKRGIVASHTMNEEIFTEPELFRSKLKTSPLKIIKAPEKSQPCLQKENDTCDLSETDEMGADEQCSCPMKLVNHELNVAAKLLSRHEGSFLS